MGGGAKVPGATPDRLAAAPNIVRQLSNVGATGGVVGRQSSNVSAGQGSIGRNQGTWGTCGVPLCGWLARPSIPRPASHHPSPTNPPPHHHTTP